MAIVSRDHLVSVTGIRAPAVKAHTVQRARFISQFRGGRFSSDKSSFPNLPLPGFCLHQRQGKPVRRNKRMEESVGFLIRHDRNERERERLIPFCERQEEEILRLDVETQKFLLNEFYPESGCCLGRIRKFCPASLGSILRMPV